jgi:hypothetical protein
MYIKLAPYWKMCSRSGAMDCLCSKSTQVGVKWIVSLKNRRSKKRRKEKRRQGHQVEWKKTPIGAKGRREKKKTSTRTKRREGNNIEWEKRRLGQHVEKEKTSTGDNVDWKKTLSRRERRMELTSKRSIHGSNYGYTLLAIHYSQIS